MNLGLLSVLMQLQTNIPSIVVHKTYAKLIDEVI